MRHIFLAAFVLTVVVLGPQSAKADEGHDVSLTFSPIHLFHPTVFELTAEVRLPLDFSVAGIGGVGAADGVTLWEAGGQVRYYLLGGFEHGMPLGVEAIYIGASDNEGDVVARANGVAVGPFVGYKFAADVGFTIDLAGGIQYMSVSAVATDGTISGSAYDSGFIPLLNFNLGWSF